MPPSIQDSTHSSVVAASPTMRPMSRFRIVITRRLPADPVGKLRQSGLDADIQMNPDDRRLEPAELDTMVSGAHAILTTPRDVVNSQVLDAAGGQLVIVSNYAVGVDNIDLAAAKQRRVIVGHTPNAVTEPTADIAWLLLLGAARRASEGESLVRSGSWTGVSPNQLLGLSLINKTLLIVGAGRIGLAVARRSLGWSMRVLYVARSRHEEFERPPLNADQVTLEEGLQEADFVSVHTPLSPQTRHLINAERLSLMKPTAVLVNTARGAVIDEAALVEALRSKLIFAAGLDVFENEPRLHPDLAKLPNVFLLPHLGSATVEDREGMTRLAVNNIIAALKGEPVPHRAA
jgi:glyoxylate reductase